MELSLSLKEMTEQAAQSVSLWQYPAPYEQYRLPLWETMLAQGDELADPHIRHTQYQAVHHDQTDELVGYIQLFPLGQTVRLGMGLRPDCCDQGWGYLLTALAVEEARRRLPEAEIDLEVEQWNKRAIRTYEKAGFDITDEYNRQAAHGTVSVFCMVWHNPGQPLIQL